ncbi:hypothetical protein N0V93_002813 [Gnomoniopsis smithogilvyi]|uniref:Uncharacterized protein n=1 Tax=Gnomoniopsis smithogilvyi TaxID=1191159 RepID=A0A9W8YVG5_9PEZI|nr:hypothetical protein N0V93_002813 [Gnomoniopsis smithogilvyi]
MPTGMFTYSGKSNRRMTIVPERITYMHKQSLFRTSVWDEIMVEHRFRSSRWIQLEASTDEIPQRQDASLLSNVRLLVKESQPDTPDPIVLSSASDTVGLLLLVPGWDVIDDLEDYLPCLKRKGYLPQHKVVPWQENPI